MGRLFMPVLILCFYLLQALQISDSHLKHHPFFVSVTDLVFDSANAQLQVSCKIFTDDFEKTLRKTYSGKIDLLDPVLKIKMDSVVAGYLNKHLNIKVNDNNMTCRYLGYEQEDDAIFCFLQVDNLAQVKKVEVLNDMLFEYKPRQTNLVHVTVGGTRKSARLNNPEARATFEF